jgi:hypothetical protein
MGDSLPFIMMKTPVIAHPDDSILNANLLKPKRSSMPFHFYR